MPDARPAAPAASEARGPYRSPTGLEERRRHARACKAAVQPDPVTHADQVAASVTRYLVDCGAAPSFANVAWTLDAGERIGEVSEVLRTGFVWLCLDPERYRLEEWTPLAVAQRYLVCGHDARALDAGKLAKELAGLGLGPALEDIARARFDEVRGLADELGAAYARLGPDVRRVLIDTPEEAWASWAQLRDGHRRAFADIQAFEAAYLGGVKKQVAGCRPVLAGHVNDYVAEKKPRTRDEVLGLANDPLGAMLYGALAACDIAEGRTLYGALELRLSRDGRLRHGPRAVAREAALATLEDVRREQARFPLKDDAPELAPAPDPDDADHLRALAAQALDRAVTQSWHTVTGTIRSARPEGSDHIRIVWQKVTRKRRVNNCRETNKIERIHPDGRIEYKLDCWFTGRYEIEDLTPRDVVIHRRLAAGLEAGHELEVAVSGRLGEDEGPPPEGFPLQVSAAADKKPVAYAGFLLR